MDRVFVGIVPDRSVTESGFDTPYIGRNAVKPRNRDIGRCDQPARAGVVLPQHTQAGYYCGLSVCIGYALCCTGFRPV